MKTILILVALILFGGCYSKNSSLMEYSNLRLEIKPQKSANTKSQKVLLVKKPKGVSYIDTRDFIYTDKEGFYSSYAYHKWDEPVSKQLENIFALTLSQSEKFESAITTSSILNYDLVLESNIYEFTHNIQDNQSKVVINIEIKVINAKTKTIVVNQRFKIEENTKSINAQGTLEAYNIALDKLLDKIVNLDYDL